MYPEENGAVDGGEFYEEEDGFVYDGMTEGVLTDGAYDGEDLFVGGEDAG
jgi:hypothetical protein